MSTVWWTKVNWPKSNNKRQFMRISFWFLNPRKCTIALLSVNFHKLFFLETSCEPRPLLIARQPGYSLLLLDALLLLAGVMGIKRDKYANSDAPKFKRGKFANFWPRQFRRYKFAIFWREISNEVNSQILLAKNWNGVKSRVSVVKIQTR